MKVKSTQTKLPTSNAKTLDENWGYFYESIFNKVFLNSKRSLLYGYILLMVIWFASAYYADNKYHFSSVVVDWWWYCIAYAISVTTGIFFLNSAKSKLKKSYIFIMNLVTSEDDTQKAINEINLIGDKKKQFVFCSAFGILVFSLAVVQKVPITAEFTKEMGQFIIIFLAIWSSLAVFLTAGVGLWVAITSFKMTNYFCGLSNIKLDFVNPAQTIGISKLAGLMGYYATLFLMQVITWELPYALTVWSVNSKRLTLIDGLWTQNNVPFTVVTGIFGVFLIILLLYFIYPQTLISSLVETKKKEVLSDIQSKINKIYSEVDKTKSAEPALLGYYLSLYKEIESNKSSLPLENLVGFSASFIASFMLSLAGKLSSLLKIP